ncbi:MAG: TlpA family protein disulfide reductase [Planctomycetia bacterium]|nr:TlpA family protein disulfide reductase [Planctomycetia bacterium]MBL6914034.1 TlpA family protein disulfide reductase [Planctomycetota bacterium]NCG57357.1 redoxin family protein [Pseudomonadota bacterium]NCF97913.1 redoxin family protein [Planctomycetia bacterium]NCG13214.1 redoxin family protein [Planctomycetia bacterium]
MCRAESPHLSRIQKEYRQQGVVVLGVNADNDGPIKIREYVSEEGLQQKMLLQGDGVGFQQYHLKRMPTVYFIDRKGVLISRSPGFQDYSALEKSLKKVLRK